MSDHEVNHASGICRKCRIHISASSFVPKECPGPVERAAKVFRETLQANLPPDVKAAIADKAKSIVTGSRRAAYGTPEDNFERIARFWQAYFENTGRGAALVTAADVSPLMRLMKEARLCETPNHADSFVDLVGYALTGAEINKVDPADFA